MPDHSYITLIADELHCFSGTLIYFYNGDIIKIETDLVLDIVWPIGVGVYISIHSVANLPIANNLKLVGYFISKVSQMSLNHMYGMRKFFNWALSNEPFKVLKSISSDHRVFLAKGIPSVERETTVFAKTKLQI